MAIILNILYNESNASMTNFQVLAQREAVEERIECINATVDGLETPLTKAEEESDESALSINFGNWIWMENAINIRAITYGNGKFVVVNNSNVYIIPERSDGVWRRTESSQFFPERLSSMIVYEGGKFISNIESVGGNIICSEDGVDWIFQNIFCHSSITGIIHGNGMYVIATGGGIFYTPRSDFTGLRKALLDFEFKPYKLCYGNGKFVVVNNCFRTGPIQTAYSYNAKDWSLGEPIFGDFITNSFESITHGNNIFAAVNKSSNIFVSSDGIHWDARQTSSLFLTSIVYGDGLLLAAGRDGCVYSSNGTTWIEVKYPNSNIFWPKIAYGNGTFMIFGHVNNYAITCSVIRGKDKGKDDIEDFLSEK